jgi:[acyl-carrier-protein] S-malonyltransferase
MKKIGLLFPGQGSQYTGMGKELYERYPEAKETIDLANDVLGFDLRKIIFEGPDDVLNQTQYTQPAIFTVSVAAYKTLAAANTGTECVCAAGHSLGEYAALCSAGFFSLTDGLKMVKARGEFIQKASREKPGTMAAILGLDRQKVLEICAKASTTGVCEAVNFNSPGQIVISGTLEAVQNAAALAGEAGASKAIVLNVSGPFHSSLMTPASEMMADELKKYSFSHPRFPVVTNCDAELTADASAVPGKLVRQINGPVLWEDSVKRMIDKGAELFIELGPQRVLSGLLRRIDKSKKCVNIEDSRSMDKTLQELAL